MDGRPIRASKCAANGAKNTGSSSSASTRPNSAGNTSSSDGKIASHNVGWSLTVLSTMASIPSIPRVRGHPPGSAPSDPGSTRRLFQVEVAIHRASTDRRDLVQTTARTWITHPPTHCPNGQPLGPGEVLVGRVRHLNTGRVEVWAEMAYRECRRSR